MKYINKYIIRSIAVLSFCVIVASCSQDDFQLISENDRMLKLTASVEGMMTRAGENDSWTTGDEIRVRIGDYPWTGHYALNADGSVKDAIDALAWPFTDGFVSAWYPYLEEGTVVSIQNQVEAKKRHEINFMAARTVREMNYKEIVKLTFMRQMVKVSSVLSAGDGVTEEDLKTATVSYYGFTSVKFSENGLTGNGNGLITPGSAWEALLLPQNMTGKPFIKVDLTVKVNGVPIDKTLIYSPESGRVNLKPERSILSI